MSSRFPTITSAVTKTQTAFPGQVKSHTKQFPESKGTSKTLSGLLFTFLSFVRDRYLGSKRDEISADAKARLIRSFTNVWRRDLPSDFRQLRPCLRILSTFSSQTQSCGEHTGAPSRSATAIRSDESSKRVPNEGQGRVWRKAPERGAAAAIKRAFPA